ncbi:MAG: hypothetical protein Q8O64_12985 [Sideroxyarcus sp.]|nr:hypothetical protein [Sideroxyarcus sp.]
MLPESLFHLPLSCPAFDAAVTRQHPLDVAIQNGAIFVVSQCTDSRCGGAPYSRQLKNVRKLVRELPLMPRNNDLRGPVQIAPSGVVTETAPVREHLLLAGYGQRGNVWKGVDEALVVRNDGGDLRLLQHDLGQPDAISVLPLPRQVVSSMRTLPRNQARSETHII